MNRPEFRFAAKVGKLAREAGPDLRSPLQVHLRRAPLNLTQGNLGRVLFVARGLDDLCEAARIQAGPADEGAIDVGLAH